MLSMGGGRGGGSGGSDGQGGEGGQGDGGRGQGAGHGRLRAQPKSGRLRFGAPAWLLLARPLWFGHLWFSLLLSKERCMVFGSTFPTRWMVFGSAFPNVFGSAK